MPATVVFYYDFISPYSYIAFKLLQRLREPWELTLDYRPVGLPHIIRSTNNSPPGNVPARRAFLQKDLARACHMHGIPFMPAADFLKTNTRGAGLVATAANCWVEAGRLHPEQTEALIAAIWDEFFAQRNASIFTENPADLLPVVGRLLTEESAQELIQLAERLETLQRLQATTDEAIAQGAYGAPTMIVARQGSKESEFFFGSDRFHHIADFLGVDPRSFFDHTVEHHRARSKM